ncbi:MAG TPA: hypothetical protein VMF86_16725 [Stellaceae bacterium]|nr:hypothetical protein [Stellaceae bacterium]
MDGDVEVGKQLRQNWFQSVQELSDLELQRRTWLNTSNTNPHWSYIEFVECYPLPDQLEDALDQGWLSRREFEVLTELGRLVGLHAAPSGDDFNNAAVLDDPAWHRVAAAAARAKQLLLPLIRDKHELDALTGSA